MALAAAAGCGQQTNYANDPRPPSPLIVTASINAQRVSISPTRVGAGPITLIVANATDTSLDVHVEPVGAGAAGPSAQSGPINPGGTTSISFEARSGNYRVSAKGAPQAATLRVGRPRPSAQNDVLLP